MPSWPLNCCHKDANGCCTDPFPGSSWSGTIEVVGCSCGCKFCGTVTINPGQTFHVPSGCLVVITGDLIINKHESDQLSDILLYDPESVTIEGELKSFNVPGD